MKNIEKIAFQSLSREAVRLKDVYINAKASSEYKAQADALLKGMGFKTDGKLTRNVPFISSEVYIHYSR